MVADRYMTGSLGELVTARGTTDSGPGAGPPPYDWAADGCSLSPGGVQIEYWFHSACLRHDFSYRDYGNGLRPGRNDDTKARIDGIFRDDVLHVCDQAIPDQAACIIAAEAVYGGERTLTASKDAFYSNG